MMKRPWQDSWVPEDPWQYARFISSRPTRRAGALGWLVTFLWVVVLGAIAGFILYVYTLRWFGLLLAIVSEYTAGLLSIGAILLGIAFGIRWLVQGWPRD